MRTMLFAKNFSTGQSSATGSIMITLLVLEESEARVSTCLASSVDFL
jgi:hypothetical protein